MRLLFLDKEYTGILTSSLESKEGDNEQQFIPR